jgi:arsenate reductase
MEEAGVDMSVQSSKSLQEYIGKLHFGYLITVCSNAEEKCPIFPGMGVRIHWPFEDPAAFDGTDGAKLEKFRQVRDQISHRIEAWLDEV